jgi:site-specific recombinase XerD
VKPGYDTRRFPHYKLWQYFCCLVANGTPLLDVSKLLRHASITMTEKHAHLAPDHLHQAVENLGFTTQSQHSAKSTKAPVLKIA